MLWILLSPVWFIFFDVFYFVRGVLQFIKYAYFADRKHPLEESVMTGVCTTNDLDFMWHMNNARYLRECDFGRFQLWIQNGVWEIVKKHRIHVTLGCSTVRYRKSLKLGNIFRIRSKILCWDEQAFYVEQKIERTSDNFLCALVWIKQTVRGKTPAEIMSLITGESVESPAFPEDIALWKKAHEVSSAALKKMRVAPSEINMCLDKTD